MKEYKYIMFNDTDPVIFPPHIEHLVVARALEHVLGKPVSAGFVSFKVGPTAFGKSHSLGGLASREVDTRIFRRLP